MRIQSLTNHIGGLQHGWRRRTAAKFGLFTVAALTCAAATADPVPQFGVTAVNAQGNALYNVTMTPNAIANAGALITGTTQLNTDAASHSQFFAVVRSPNSVTSALDLIVADASKYQIVRYAGPGPTYQPSTNIFSYSKRGSGPNKTTGLAVDVVGNLYAASAGVPSDSKPALWVLPFNAATGAYGAPVLIDNLFGGVKNCGSIDEVVVANAAASPVGTAVPAWNQGDVLVLLNGNSGGASVLVYSQAAIAGVLSHPSVPLTGPTSVLIGSFGGEKPSGIDLWPADTTYPASGHGVSLLIPTASGRVMRFDSSTGAFVTDFADGLGNGLLKIKVSTYSTFPYAFVAQATPGTGRILQFGAPPASGANTPLASVSTGVNNPEGLAVTNSASQPVGDCIAPKICAPLGAQLTTQITTSNLNPNNPLLEESCVVNADPRVTASISAGTWSCAGGTLDIANFCPGFPSTLLPGSMCGHSGPTGSGFVVVKSTAKAVDQDPNINNSFIENTVDANLPLPGALNLNCPQVPMFAWAPRSDLPGIEGTIPEGNTFIDLSGFCDDGGGHTHVLSMISYGLGLNSVVGPNSLPRGLPGFVDDKFANLTQTITNAGSQINDGGTTQGYVTQAKTYFDTGVANTDANAYSCAMNTIATADGYVRGNPANFSGSAPPGNPNPAGDIDGRLANLFLTIDVDFLLQPPNTGWPTSNVPPCMTFTATPTTVIAPGAAQLNWSSGTGPYQAASCLLSASDGSFTTSTPFVGAGGSVSTGTLNKVGTYSAQLMCSTASSTITGFAQTTVNVIQLAAISVGPAAPPPQIAAGGTVQLAATGTYSDQSTKDVTSSVSWASADTTVATVTPAGGLVTCVSTASMAKQVVISAMGATATGTIPVTCLAPTLTSVVVAPASPTLAAGSSVQLTATANFSFGPPQNVTSSASWSSSNSGVATVTGGLVTCIAGANSSATITAMNGGGSGSTTVNCQAPVLQSVVVAPPNPTLAAGATAQLTATANYSYGSPVNVTGSATWNTSNASVATVLGGLVTCVAGANNAATITASLSSGGSGSTTVNCQAPVLKSISVSPTSSGEIGEIPNGGTQQMTATGTYSSGPPRNITSLVTWTSSSTYVATVSATGVLSCRRRYTYSDGNTTISATSGTTTGSSNITCEGLGQ
ncbi:MAG TPA: Ig-like domain-containing protein [Steroidobacteraceae bacterium]|nr:Ig-like domain-containing protein [Steroidobacteraceae bacterium]